MTTLYPEVRVEQSPDGAFRRQANRFRTRFGDAPGEALPEAGRYQLIVSAGCGWSRRALVVRRLLGLTQAIGVSYVSHRGQDGWEFGETADDVDPVLGVPRLNDLYRAHDPGYTGRGTVPTVVDLTDRAVVTNDYHTLTIDLETAWAPLHGPGAPDLYPVDLRARIDLIDQQLFDDVNNGPYKVIFATSSPAATVAKGVWEARLADLDLRLTTRRYLFGDRLTESDVRLFVTLASFDTGYRPSFPRAVGPAKAITDFPNLWAYARDLFATPGFVDEREKAALGLLPGADGRYRYGFGPGLPAPAGHDPLAPWLEPPGREFLTGSAEASGPGDAGLDVHWQFAARATGSGAPA
jgi:putative glutathione S-transferase